MFGDLQPCDLNQIGHALSRVLLFTKFISFHSDLFCHCWSQQGERIIDSFEIYYCQWFQNAYKVLVSFWIVCQSAFNSQTSVLYVIIPYFVKSNEIQIVRVEKKLCMYNIWNWKFIKLNIFQNKLHVLQS